MIETAPEWCQVSGRVRLPRVIYLNLDVHLVKNISKTSRSSGTAIAGSFSFSAPSSAPGRRRPLARLVRTARESVMRGQCEIAGERSGLERDASERVRPCVRFSVQHGIASLEAVGDFDIQAVPECPSLTGRCSKLVPATR